MIEIDEKIFDSHICGESLDWNSGVAWLFQMSASARRLSFCCGLKSKSHAFLNADTENIYYFAVL